MKIEDLPTDQPLISIEELTKFLSESFGPYVTGLNGKVINVQKEYEKFLELKRNTKK